MLSRGWHVAAFSLILFWEAVTALLLIDAATLQVAGHFGAAADLVNGFANVAVAAFVALASLMIAGGSWFAYHVKQGLVQLTHLVMLAAGAGAAVLVNLPAVQLGPQGGAGMVRVFKSGGQPSRKGNIRFEGGSCGAGTSLFLVDNKPGKGPPASHPPLCRDMGRDGRPRAWLPATTRSRSEPRT